LVLNAVRLVVHKFVTFSGFRKHLYKAQGPSSGHGEGSSTAEYVAGSHFDDLPSTSTPSDAVNKILVDRCAATIANLKVAG
jgi:hypothetical protein